MSNRPFGAPGMAVASREGGLPPLAIQKQLRRVTERGIWSTYQWARTTALANGEYRVFATARGEVGQGFANGLTIAETNIREAGRIPNAQGYNVWGIAVQPYTSNNYPVTAADLFNVTNQCVIQWDFLETQIDVCPVSLAGAGGGVFGATADTGAAYGGLNGSQVALNNGNGSIWIYQSLPVILGATTTFNIVYRFGQNASAVDGGGASVDYSLDLRTVLLGMVQTALPQG